MFLGGLEPSFAEAMLAWSFAKLGGNGAVDAVMAALAESARQQVEERQAELLGSEWNHDMGLSENGVSHIPMDYHHVPH